MNAITATVRETTETHAAVAGPLPDITRVEALRRLLAAHEAPYTVEDVSTTWYSVVARAFRRGSRSSSGNY
jgi:hypothetical protein